MMDSESEKAQLSTQKTWPLGTCFLTRELGDHTYYFSHFHVGEAGAGLGGREAATSTGL